MSEEKYRVVNAHGQKVVIDNGGRCIGSLDEIVDRFTESNSAEWVAVPKELLEAVAHHGINIGLGTYEIEPKHIQQAQDILTQLTAEDN